MSDYPEQNSRPRPRDDRLHRADNRCVGLATASFADDNSGTELTGNSLASSVTQQPRPAPPTTARQSSFAAATVVGHDLALRNFRRIDWREFVDPWCLFDG